MKFLRLDLLTLLISLFILNSCKNENTIGLPINSSTQRNSSMIDTSTVVINTVPEDSVITSGLNKTPMGYFQDPAFGSTEANIAVGLNLPNGTSYSLPTGTVVVDSAVLALKYANGFYGDSLTSKYKVNVYQLGTRPLSKAYYNTTDFSKNLGPLVGTRTFFSRTHDSIKVYNIIKGAPDTLIRVVPQLRIPIDKNFINSILFNASSTQLGSNTVFQNNVKGLYLTIDKAGSSGPGGLFMFGLSDSLRVYYHTISGTTIDTANVALPLSTNAHTAQIVRTPSAAIQTELANTGSSRNVVYLQGLAGLKAKISFPYLKNILTTLGTKIVINKAQLVISPVPGSTIPYSPQPKLTMYRWDIAHSPIELEDANSNDPRYGGVGTFGGYYNITNKNYVFTVTGYIQDLMDGRTTDYGTFIAPVDNTNTTSVDISPTPQTAGRAIVVGSDKNSPYRIKLNIIYTKINH